LVLGERLLDIVGRFHLDFREVNALRSNRPIQCVQLNQAGAGIYSLLQMLKAVRDEVDGALSDIDVRRG